MKLKKPNRILSILSLILMVFFHHWNINFKYLFPFELIFIFPLIVINYKFILRIINKRFNSLLIISFSLLIFINIFSALNGNFRLNNVDFDANLAVSITYLLMLVFFLFGIVLSKYIEPSTIYNLFGVLLFFTFSIVLLEFLFYETKIILIEFYDIESNVNLESIKYRTVGPFKNSNSLAVATSFFLSVIVSNNKSILKSTVFLITSGFIVAVSGSRTGFLIFLIFISYVVFIQKSSKIKKVGFLSLILIAIIYFLQIIDFSKYSIFQRLSESTFESALNLRKSIYWNDTLNLILKYPFFGTGLAHNNQITVDNFYLSILKSNGIIGFSLYFIPFFMILFYSFKNIRKNRIELILIIMVFLISSFTGDFYFSRPFYPLLFTLLGFYINIGLKESVTTTY